MAAEAGRGAFDESGRRRRPCATDSLGELLWLRNDKSNRRLVFLPTRLVRYVLLHELAHTVEMNHSQRFWGEDVLQSLAPDYRDVDEALRNAWTLIPAWAR